MPWKRRRKKQKSSHQSTVTLLGITAAAAPLLLGGAPIWSALAVFGLLVLCALLAVFTGRHGRQPIPVVALIPLVAGIAVALRFIPEIWSWPPPLAGSIGVFPEGLDPALEGKPGTLLLAPGGAARYVVHCATVVLALGLSHILCARRPAVGETLVRWSLIGGGVVLALVYVDLVFGLDEVTGFRRKVDEGFNPVFLSTIADEGHLGAYLVFCAGVSLAAARQAAGERIATLFRLMAVAAAIGALLSSSPSAILAGGVLVVFLGITLFERLPADMEGSQPARRVPFAIAVALVVAVAGFYLTDYLIDQYKLAGRLGAHTLEDTSAGVIGAIEVLGRHPFSGIGPGAFVDLMAGYSTGLPEGHWEYARSFPLQVLLDHGLVLGGLLLLFGSVLAVRIFRFAIEDHTRLILAATVATVVLQNLVDYNLELAGVAVPVAVVTGVLTARAPGLEWGAVPRWTWVLAAAALGLGFVWPAWWGDRGHTTARLAEAAREGAPYDDALREDLLLFPRSGRHIALAAEVVQRERGLAEALPWFEKARELAPESFDVTLAAAVAHQSSRAYVEAARGYAMTCRGAGDDSRRHEAWADRLVLLPDGYAVLDELARAEPRCVEPVLELLWDRGQVPEVAKSASIAMASSPDTPRLRYWRARAAVELGLTEVAEVDAAYLLGLYADRAEGFVIEAQLRIRADEPRVASALLEEALERDPDWAEVPFDLAEAAIKTGDAGAFSVAMARLASVRTRDLDTREQLHSLKARFAMASGDAETAVREFGRAKRTLQRSPAQRLLYIEALVEVQRFTAARRLCTEGGGWPEKDREKAKELCDRAASGGPF